MNLSWYNTLNKPPMTPPSFIFGIVWGILYILIIISFVFYIRKGVGFRDILPLSFFLTGLVLNFLWPFVFFLLHEITLSFVLIILMILLLVITIILFYKKSKISALLLLPYLFWLIYAAYLNFGFIVNN